MTEDLRAVFWKMVAKGGGTKAHGGGRYMEAPLAFLEALLDIKTAWLLVDGLTVRIYLYEKADGEKLKEFFGAGDIRWNPGDRDAYDEFVLTAEVRV